MSSGYMYILECADGSFYTGSTKNLELRLAQHQSGQGANHTRKRLPVKLVYCEEFQKVDEAFYREKQIQGWSRKKKKALIEGNFEKLSQLAECQNDSHCAGFDSAQPPTLESDCSQSVVEGKEIKRNKWSSQVRSLSVVEGKGENDAK